MTQSFIQVLKHCKYYINTDLITWQSRIYILPKTLERHTTQIIHEKIGKKGVRCTQYKVVRCTESFVLMCCQIRAKAGLQFADRKTHVTTFPRFSLARFKIIRGNINRQPETHTLMSGCYNWYRIYT